MAVKLLDEGQALLGAQPGSDNMFQCGMDLGEQTVDAVRRPDRFGGEVLVEAHEDSLSSARVSSSTSMRRRVWGIVLAVSAMTNAPRVSVFAVSG